MKAHVADNYSTIFDVYAIEDNPEWYAVCSGQDEDGLWDWDVVPARWVRPHDLTVDHDDSGPYMATCPCQTRNAGVVAYG